MLQHGEMSFHNVQANKYTAFIENTGFKVAAEKCPTLLQGRRKGKRIERDFISSCKEKLAEGFDLECEMESLWTPDFFGTELTSEVTGS